MWVDAYNQSINYDIAGTLTTRVDGSNMYYVTEICSSKEEKYTHTKVSIGATPRPSSEVSLEVELQDV